MISTTFVRMIKKMQSAGDSWLPFVFQRDQTQVCVYTVLLPLGPAWDGSQKPWEIPPFVGALVLYMKQHGVLRITFSILPIHFSSSPDHLQHLTQCKCSVSSCYTTLLKVRPCRPNYLVSISNNVTLFLDTSTRSWLNLQMLTKPVDPEGWLCVCACICAGTFTHTCRICLHTHR